MRQEKLVKLLCELIKDSRRSDRDLAKVLGFSQSSVSRFRKILEREAILKYTTIPDFSYLGFDLMVFTIYRMKESLQPSREKAENWLKKQPSVVFSSECQGMEADRVMISVHRNYADFSEFHQKFRRELDPHFESFKTLLVSLRGHEISKLFMFDDLVTQLMPNLSIIDSQRRRWKRSIPPSLMKTGPVLDITEGEFIVLTYTSMSDKMKVFSAFIREGLESGDAVQYNCPDKESETVRAKLEKHGIDVEEYEKDGTLRIKSLTEIYMSDGKLDYEKAINDHLNSWAEVKEKGYRHLRIIEDVGDLSFAIDQMQKFIDYTLDPRWNNPDVSEWVARKELGGIEYVPFIMEISAINVEHLSETQVHEILEALGGEESLMTRFIDLLKYVDVFSKIIGLSHKELFGRKFLLEFDPTSDYETIIEDFARESMANVEPVYVFTSAISSLHKRLAKLQTIKLFSMSASTSTIRSISENEVLIPTNNIDLILDSIDNVAKTYPKTNMSLVFDGLSDILSSLGPERTVAFLNQVLHTLSSERTTTLFLLNTSAHNLKIVSRLRSMFDNQLIYTKAGLQTVKLS